MELRQAGALAAGEIDGLLADILQVNDVVLKLRGGSQRAIVPAESCTNAVLVQLKHCKFLVRV